MTQKNPSLYFENSERFMQEHPDKVPLDVLKNIIKRNGCPEQDVDSIVNGAIVQELNRKVTPKEPSVSVYHNGKRVPSIEPYNPSYEELINDAVSRFEGLDANRAKQIVDFLISKRALTVYPDGKLYRMTALLPRMSVSLLDIDTTL